MYTNDHIHAKLAIFVRHFVELSSVPFFEIRMLPFRD